MSLETSSETRNSRVDRHIFFIVSRRTIWTFQIASGYRKSRNPELQQAVVFQEEEQSEHRAL